MKTFWTIASAIVVLVATPALARKAPPPVAAWSWSGFYLGGNLGYGWGKVDANTALLGFAGAGVALPNSNSRQTSGIVGGGQIGYNWQVSPTWVAGFEADWQATGERKGFSVADPYTIFPLTAGTGTANFTAKLPWFGTVRGRLGYVANNNMMFYATGGLAYGAERVSGTSNDSGFFFIIPYNNTTSFGSSRTATGWTAGGGVEGPLADKWTWKLEYLYVDLGALNFTSLGPFPATETISEHTKFMDNIMRVGLNYHFN